MHYVRSLWYKHQKDFAEFYKSSLLYLAFISSDALPAEQKLVRRGVPAHLASPASHAVAAVLKVGWR